MELHGLLAEIDRFFGDQAGLGDVEYESAGFCCRSQSAGRAERSREFGEKSAANRMVSKGFMGVSFSARAVALRKRGETRSPRRRPRF